ncbi:MAG: hypothetical protein KF729_26845 [Sandaracinaceae bacterium]|nr:hypothetical protein [Sandaracinaceae bacterium]MBX3273911.1 hypothetical protein [Sandaracinaceae bacterium]
MKRTTVARALLITLALASATACGRGAVALRTETPVLLQAAADPAALRAAIVRALEARRYTTESEEPGAIVARMSQRGTMLRVRVDYSGTDYRITYLESEGLEHRVDAAGHATISRRYDGWVAQLQRSIADELARPEREAREAVEEQRRHELAVIEEQRRREQEARDHQSREQERERRAQLERERHLTERERLRAEQARAEAEARRPVIVDHTPYVVDSMVVAPRQRVRARFASIDVDGRVRTRWLDGQAEGDIDSTSIGLPASCRGFYAGTPEHLLQVRRGVDYLRLETDAEGDPTLMLVASDGAVYCDDDGGEGLNSRIEGSFPPGTYRVYVGSYRAGESARYRLLVSAERAEAPRPDVARRAPRDAPPAPCRTVVIEMGHNPVQGMHCDGAEPRCAEALLRAGHSPAQLLHCRGVEPACAVASLRAGHSPAQLLHCR